MERRKFGRTGESLSMIGFGGIVVMNEEQDLADRVVAEAIDRGVNYFDVAPSYGNAEDKLGPAIKGYRDRIFLACKTGRRTKDGAAEELRQSLRKLGTDHFDLYQLHGMTSDDDYNTVMGPGGALEAFVEARDAGLIRHIGFSTHSVPVALKLIENFDFASVLFPFNWVNCFNGNFGPQILDAARAKGMGAMALKAMAKTEWGQGEERHGFKGWYKPMEDPGLAAIALRFTLSQPVTAAIPPGDIPMFRLALDVAEKFTPISDDEIAYLKEKAVGLKPIFWV